MSDLDDLLMKMATATVKADAGGAFSLRDIITEAASEYGKPLKDFTVLSPQRDPYRLDTAANHMLGQWLASAYEQVNPEARRLHLRGLHYALVGRVLLPTGKPYTNTDETWLWLSDKAAKAARYLGYLPWDAIRDARNAPPQIFTPEFEDMYWWLHTASVELTIPMNLDPQFILHGDKYRQPCRQVVIAEKQGVEDVLLPVCKKRQATLALPAGEISDTMVYELLRDANEDGRPLVIHQVGDFDPAGWQMAVSTGRTAQAIRDSQFPDLDITIHPVALNRDHCEDWNLPSTPLKETELRGDRWIAARGREQTELDAAVALAPDQFAKVVDDSLLQYFDTDIHFRAFDMCKRLEEEANAHIEEKIGKEALEAIRAGVQEKIDEAEGLVEEINDALKIKPSEVGVKSPEVPEVLIGDTACRYPPLLDTADGWVTATQSLISRKRY